MKDRLIVAGFNIDLKDGIAFPLNFSIADFRDPQGRKRSFSKQLTILGTQNNLNFLYSTYSLSLINIGNAGVFQFDPTIQQPCEYYKDEILVFKGLFHLKEVKQRNGTYEFTAELLSDVVDLFGRLKNIGINELPRLQLYAHGLTRTNIINSFDTSVIRGGVPTANFSGGLPLGFGYLYPLVDYGYNRPTDTHFQINQLIPHWYVRELMIQAFAFADLEISSTFFDTQFFRNLVIGSGDGTVLQLDSTEINNRRVLFDAVINNTNFASPLNIVQANLFIINEQRNMFLGQTSLESNIVVLSETDPRNQYSLTDGQIVVERTGTYRTKLVSTIDLDFITDGTFGTLGSFKLIASVRRNGAFVGSTTVNIAVTDFTITNVINLNLEVDAYFQQGDIVTLDFTVQTNATVTGATSASAVLTNTGANILDFDFTSLDTTLIEGATVDPVRAIPNMKASDFVATVIKMFNLYVSDPVDGVVTIEPFSDFYQATSVFDDWTNLIDHSKDIVIKPASTIDGKFYNYRFADDNDYFRNLYQTTWGAGYGDRQYQVPSTFQVGEKTTELAISQSVVSDRNTGLLMPCIFQFNSETLSIQPFKGKPRMYFYNGLKTGNWRLKDVLSGLFTDLTDYPSVHHFDDWENPTFDLNFKLPEELYYTTTDITFTNLWSEYHEEFIKELTGRDSKLLDCYVRMTPQRIKDLDFGKLKMINGVLFRLNTVKDFDSSITESTKVELMKYLG